MHNISIAESNKVVSEVQTVQSGCTWAFAIQTNPSDRDETWTLDPFLALRGVAARLYLVFTPKVSSHLKGHLQLSMAIWLFISNVCSGSNTMRKCTKYDQPFYMLPLIANENSY